MSSKRIYSYEEKVKIISEYLNGERGFCEICRVYGINQGSLNNWARLYKAFGLSGLQTVNKCSKYSAEVKKAALDDYFSKRFTIPEILLKYEIRSSTQLRRWIMKYNGHEELKSSGTGGTAIMTKGRKTTYEERIEIIQYCIEHQNNYAETAEKYKVSYQQVYSWVWKYKSSGIDAIVDRRGQAKPIEKMTELERLRAENRLLKSQNKRQEMEIDFLKKLDEIERRRG